MPFNAANLRALAFGNELTIWYYDATDEAPPTASGLFDPVAGLLRRGDLIFWSQINGATKQTGLLLVAQVEPDRLVIEALDSGSAETPGGLHDILITAAEAGQVLTFDGQTWTNRDPIGASGDAHSGMVGNPHQTTAADIGAIGWAEKGAIDGVATLDASGTVPLAQLPFLPHGDVTSVFGRNGAVAAEAGDYTADQIADTDNRILMTIGERTKLASIEDGASANPPPVIPAERATGSETQPRTFAPADVREMAVLHAPVASVAGKTGEVKLVAEDVGAAAASHIGSGDGAHAIASAGAAGFMSGADKTKLDAVQASAQINPPVMSDAQALAGSDQTPRTPSAAQLKLAAQTWGNGSSSGGGNGRSIMAPADENPEISLELPSAMNRRNFLLAFTASGAVTTTKMAQATDLDRLVAEAPVALTDLSQLKKTEPMRSKAVVLLGRASPGDGGGGTFYWDAMSTEAENGGTIFAAAAKGPGRWRRMTNGEAINVRWFGAKGDGVADDLPAFKLAEVFARLNGYDIDIPKGVYRLTGTWRIGPGVIMTVASALSESMSYDRSVQSIAARHYRPLVKGECGTIIWGDFDPGAADVPILEYQMTAPGGVPTKTSGGFSNLTIVGKDGWSGGRFSSIRGESARTSVRQIGIFALSGCVRISEISIREIHYGLLTASQYWCGINTVYIWRANYSISLMDFSASECRNVQMWYSGRGMYMFGNASSVKGIHTEQVDEDIVIPQADGSEFGPAYLEDVLTDDGTGKYSVKLGAADGTKAVTHCTFTNIRIGGALRPNKKAYGILKASQITFLSCRAYAHETDFGATSYGALITCDFNAPGNYATNWKVL